MGARGKGGRGQPGSHKEASVELIYFTVDTLIYDTNGDLRITSLIAY